MAELHRWIDRQGQEWACGAYDHGPFCRLCQPVDAVLHSCLENVELGYMRWQIECDGQFSFRVTREGYIHAMRVESNESKR